MSHTPGPWRTAHDIPGLGGVVASLGTTLDEKSHFILATEVVTDEMVPANARLIAGSPMLLEAAKEVLHQLTRNRTHDVQGDWNLADGYGLDDEVAALSEAITAAEGGAS